MEMLVYEQANSLYSVSVLQELLIEPEVAVDGLTLLDLDAVMQERLEKLQQTKKERQETLRNLQEKDEVRVCVGGWVL